jgi:hypothetical protein
LFSWRSVSAARSSSLLWLGLLLLLLSRLLGRRPQLTELRRGRTPLSFCVRRCVGRRHRGCWRRDFGVHVAPSRLGGHTRVAVDGRGFNRLIPSLVAQQKTKLNQEWHLSMLFFVELNKTNEVKFWLTIYSYRDVSMIMVIIIKKNKYLKKSHKN